VGAHDGERHLVLTWLHGQVEHVWCETYRISEGLLSIYPVGWVDGNPEVSARHIHMSNLKHWREEA